MFKKFEHDFLNFELSRHSKVLKIISSLFIERFNHNIQAIAILGSQGPSYN